MANQGNYPDHLIDPKKKDKEWVSKYLKAAWGEYDSLSPKIFYSIRLEYQTIKGYAQGNQSINKYKPWMGIDDDNDETFMNIDWSVIPIVPKYRRIALSKLYKAGFNIVATPIDPSAIEEKEKEIAEMKTRIALKEELEKLDPEIINELPQLQPPPGDPHDLEELEIYAAYTYKHRMAIEMEDAIKLVFFQNKMSEVRKQVLDDTFDFGVGGYKDWIDSNGAVRIRRSNPENLIISYCEKKDFSDAQHVGEVIEISIAELKQWAGDQFTDEEYQKIAQDVSSKYGNPRFLPDNGMFNNKSYMKWKIRILDMEFFSVNEDVYQQRTNRRGNKVFGLTSYNQKNNKKEKYVRSAYKVVYKGCWIIDTDKYFNCGLATDMKRTKSNLVDTELSYHLYAPDFYNMNALGMMSQLIPIADQIQIAWYRLQNVISSARPKGISIEMGALEDVPLGKGGAAMEPMKLIDLFEKKGILVYRRMDSQGRQVNYKPIEELNNGLGNEATQYFNLIQQYIQMIRDITGLNELTDGSTPDPKMLTTIANAAIEGSSNSLYHILDGDRSLLERLASAVVMRVQDAIKNGPVEGYIKSLGKNTVDFIKVSSDISSYEYGIQIQDKPSEADKQRLQQYVQASLGDGMNGNLDMEDALYIEAIDNIKLAQKVLAYRLKKKRKERVQEAQQQQQMNGQIQQQSAQVAEQSKQQTAQLESQLKAQLLDLEKKYDLALLDKRYQYEIELEKMRSGSKVDVAKVYNNQDPVSTSSIGGVPMLPETMDNMAAMVQQQQSQQQMQPQQMQPQQ
jgi:hypothetical protein